ncbi:MAG: hypothetical protein M3R00_09185 [Pseudomonadota bacterium]|nr:hypothetical protein [Pseudomonadota bacterium]
MKVDRRLIHPAAAVAAIILAHQVLNQFCSKNLSYNDKVKLALVNRSCFLFFYYQDNLIAANKTSPGQLRQLTQKYSGFFEKEDNQLVAAIEAKYLEARASAIRDSVTMWPNGFKRQVEIASIMTNLDEDSAYIIVRDGYFQDTAKPMQTLERLCAFPKAKNLAIELKLIDQHTEEHNNNKSARK